MQWFNTTDYSISALVFLLLSSIGWVVAYIAVIVHERKYGFVEMPMFIACGNFAWEFMYSWVSPDYINTGFVFGLGVKIWFFLDVYIFWLVFKDGGDSLQTPLLQQYFTPLVVVLILMWMPIMYSLIVSGLDTIPFMSKRRAFGGAGGLSAFILNFGISFLYLLQYVQSYKKRVFSKLVAWSKWLGTACATAFFFLADAENYFLLTLGVLVFIMDVLYLVLIYALRPSPQQTS
jgi:hypothetical protein